MDTPLLRLFDGFDHTSPQLRDAVKTLQRELRQEKFRLRPDGLFGHDTEDAVKRFQRAHGLDDDGVVGPLTWATMFEDQPPPSDDNFPSSTGVTSAYSPDNPELRRQLAEAGQYKVIVVETSRTHDIPVSVIAGIGSRESQWGLALKLSAGATTLAAGTGDFAKRSYPTRYRTGPLPPDGGGYGRGLMQIDFDYHEFARTGNWADPQANIRYGCQVIADSREFLRRKAGVREAILLRASLAAYNAGPANALRALRDERDVDFYTAGRDYSRDVLGRADFFRAHGWT